MMLLVIQACGKKEADPEEEWMETVIRGQVTVDPELDDTGDYSGIRLLIRHLDGVQGERSDTLFYAETDLDGFYEGVARYPERNFYALSLRRSGDELAHLSMVLAPGDTVTLNAQLPNVAGTMELSSYENDLIEQYDRLDLGVNRVLQFIQAGVVTGDTVYTELQKWSDLFWTLYDDHPQTMAGAYGAVTSAELLEGWNPEGMLERMEAMPSDNDLFVHTKFRLGSRYYAEEYGLNRSLEWIDGLIAETEGPLKRSLEMDRIRVLYDSLRVQQVAEAFEEFREEYGEDSDAQEWIERFEVDLATLAPGAVMPDFEVVSLDGETVSRESLLGQAYLLEFTRLNDALYQAQFDRTIALYHIYSNSDVEFVTIPLSSTTIQAEAFFEERPKFWPIARPGTFDADLLRERFNVHTMPTRILVDPNGRVIRKYEGEEFNDIIHGLRQVLNDNLEDPTL